MKAGYKIYGSTMPYHGELASWLSILGIFLRMPSLPPHLNSSLSLPAFFLASPPPTTMNAIDSPLEALAFNYATFGFFTLVNNLWTWFALLTAALSLWKIRAKPHFPPPPTPPQPSNDRTLHGSTSTKDDRPVENFVLHEAPGTSMPKEGVFSAGDGDVEGVTKGKFTMYYEDDRECESDEELKEACCDGGCGCGCTSEWWEKWDKVLETRLGVKGWYTCQDLTDLNGNVVRFWDSGIDNGRFSKEVRHGPSCIVW